MASQSHVGTTASLAVVAAVVSFLSTLTRSAQYATRQTVVSMWTPLDWLVHLGGPYLAIPGLLVVLVYLIRRYTANRLLTRTTVAGLGGGVVVGHLFGQYIGGEPHALLFFLSAAPLQLRLEVLRLSVDTVGPLIVDFCTVVGGVAIVQLLGHPRPT